jgi:uncharacterized protein (DUF58 family)
VNPSSLEQTLKSSLTPEAGQRAARPGKPRAAPPPRARPRRSNRLTVEGSLFILLTLLIGMAAVNSGHNLLYLVFSVMLAMLLLSGALARLNLRRLSVQRRYPLEFHCDEPVPAQIEIHNGKRLFGSYVLRVEDELAMEGPGGRRHKPARVTAMAALVPPVKTVHCSVQLRLPHRGLYRLVSLRIVSRYPFSFFKRSLRYDTGGQMLVYPRLVPAHLFASHVPPALGEHDADRKGMGIGLFGIRNYQDGDPARLIHWKHSAKGQGLKLKEFEEERARAFRLILDLRSDDPEATAADPAFEKAISVAASLARHLLQRHCSVALWTTYGRVPMGSGRVQLQRIMRALARVVPQDWEAEIPFMETENREVATYWIVFQDPQSTPRGVDRGFRRPHNTHVIDVRRMAAAETKPTTGETPDGH